MLQLIFTALFITQLFASEKVTSHRLELEGEHFEYTAIVSTDDEISYISYTHPSGENRPITFVFNGGPGSSSVWLHMGTFGPKKFVGPEEGGSITPPYEIADNLDTILDMTDLVFIDPPGTGFSKDNEEAYSVQADIECIAKFIRNHLTRTGRWNSPKYLAGESYGAMRAAGLADHLQNEYGIYLNGIILISAAVDFQSLVFEEDNLMPYYLFLPTYATTAWYHGKASQDLSLEEVVTKAREFALKIYAPSLIFSKSYDRQEIFQELAKLTGLSEDYILKNNGKIEDHNFVKELFANEKKVVARFDGREIGEPGCILNDPSYAKIGGIVTATLHEYLHKNLDFTENYQIVSFDVNQKWNFRQKHEFGYPSLMYALRSSLKNNPSMKVFVACGLFDLATPFTTMEYCIDHLDTTNQEVDIRYYEGGHMFYSNPTARSQFKRDLALFYQK